MKKLARAKKATAKQLRQRVVLAVLLCLGLAWAIPASAFAQNEAASQTAAAQATQNSAAATAKGEQSETDGSIAYSAEAAGDTEDSGDVSAEELLVTLSQPLEVSNAVELQTAVNNAQDGELTVLTLTQDIVLAQSMKVTELTIPANKVIRLQGGYELITANSGFWDNNTTNTTVDVYGTLIIDGATVTHNGQGYGDGIEVFSGGALTLASGAISENGGATFYTSGVRIKAGGTFTMNGGAIHNNAGRGQGTAVRNEGGTFTMNGGAIHNNDSTAIWNSAGGTFTMNGGEIYGHQSSGGAGVTSCGTFIMTGGKIRDNFGTSYGGGVCVSAGVFTMEGGEIYNNQSSGKSWTSGGGGGVYLDGGTTVFTMTGGKIYGNSSTYAGGGIYARKDVKVAVNGGEISGNTAPHGGGVFMEYWKGYKSEDTPMASAGLEDYANLTVGQDAVFYGNSAQAAYGRDPVADAVYASNIAGSHWTAPFTQGYNNYDINHIYGTPAVIHTVTFEDWNGDVLETQMVERGGDAAAPDDPTREGYTFGGWDRDFTNVQGNLTVVAQYEANPIYVVTFVGWDDTVLETQMVERGGDAAAPNDPTREGYTFGGWDRDFTNVQSDLTVLARYEMNLVTGIEEDSTTPPTLTPVVTPPDVTPVVNATNVIETLQDEGVPTIEVGETEIPLIAGNYTDIVWALLNLVMAVIGIVLALITAVYVATRKNQRSQDADDSRSRFTSGISFVGMTVAVVAAVVGAVVFLLTEDVTLPMVFVDGWTLLMAIILVVGIVGMIIGFRFAGQEDDKTQQANTYSEGY